TNLYGCGVYRLVWGSSVNRVGRKVRFLLLRPARITMIIIITTWFGEAKREEYASPVSTTTQTAVATVSILCTGCCGSRPYPARCESGPGCARFLASASTTVGATAGPRGRAPGVAPSRRPGCGCASKARRLGREFRAGPAASET